MKRPTETRLFRLRQLAAQWGGPVSLAQRVGYSNASYLVQMIGPNPTRPITEKTARKIEEKLELPRGWLDNETDISQNLPAVIEDILVDVVRLAGTIAEDAGVRLNPAKFAEVVALIYQDAQRRGTIDEDLARRLIHLAK